MSDNIEERIESLTSAMVEDQFKKNLVGFSNEMRKLLDSPLGKGLSKNELRQLVLFATSYPMHEEAGVKIGRNMLEFVQLAVNAKQDFLAMSVQQLVENSKQQAEQEQIAPAFKGEENE